MIRLVFPLNFVRTILPRATSILTRGFLCLAKFHVFYVERWCTGNYDIGKRRVACVFAFRLNDEKIVFLKCNDFVFKLDCAFSIQHEKSFVKTVIDFPRISTVAEIRDGIFVECHLTSKYILVFIKMLMKEYGVDESQFYVSVTATESDE